MVSTPFESILKEFEPFFNCPLTPDSHQSCLIKMGIGISVQMELNRQDLLLIGCQLGALPMSRYRDNIIQAALKSNGAFPPSTGTFGFSHESNQLILFLLIDPHHLNANKISALLTPFVEKAKLWSDAIAKGETPVIQTATERSARGIFGLMS